MKSDMKKHIIRIHNDNDLAPVMLYDESNK